MVYNQLFVEKPSLELLNKLITKIGLKDITDNTEFTIIDMNLLNTIVSIKQIENDIQNCYIPCKRVKYAEKLDNKAIITILRQFLKVHDYDLQSREKFIKGTKYLVYKIITKQDKEFAKKNKKYQSKKEITIVFD
jgi:hypothetical protein